MSQLFLFIAKKSLLFYVRFFVWADYEVCTTLKIKHFFYFFINPIHFFFK